MWGMAWGQVGAMPLLAPTPGPAYLPPFVLPALRPQGRREEADLGRQLGSAVRPLRLPSQDIVLLHLFLPVPRLLGWEALVCHLHWTDAGTHLPGLSPGLVLPLTLGPLPPTAFPGSMPPRRKVTTQETEGLSCAGRTNTGLGHQRVTSGNCLQAHGGGERMARTGAQVGVRYKDREERQLALVGHRRGHCSW